MSFAFTISLSDKLVNKLMQKQNLGLDSSEIRKYVVRLVEKDLEEGVKA